MALITWNDQLSVNIGKIDLQHKKLVELINRLCETMQEGKGKEFLGKVLSELKDYTVYHFGTEEKLFQEYGYPGYQIHKKEHDDLTSQVVELKDKFDKGDMMITIKVLHFLKDWLNQHIMGSDKKYTPFLNSKGIT